VTYNDRQEILCQACTDIALHEETEETSQRRTSSSSSGGQGYKSHSNSRDRADRADRQVWAADVWEGKVWPEWLQVSVAGGDTTLWCDVMTGGGGVCMSHLFLTCVPFKRAMGRGHMHLYAMP